jgi:type IV pilus modification protein PilV
MSAISRIRSNRGFSLIEVLVAVVILSVGLLALASLQLSVIRSSSEAKAEAAAAAIAKDQIEHLRSFTTVVPGYRDNIDTTTWANVTDNGGLGGVAFQWQQTVTRYVYDKGTSAFVSKGNTLTDAQIIAGCAQCLTGKDFKRVVVDVRWNDAAGNSRTISMEDVIDSLEPSESAKVVRTNTGSSPRHVKVVIVNPGSVGGVIPIAIGDGTSTAASNPTPQIRGANNEVSETRFDVFTYAAINSSLATAESRVETLVMHCTCSTANAPVSGSRGYRPTYWNGYRYAPPTLTSYTPPAGWVTDSAESERCDICCRDHNDPNNVSGPKFDPWRTSAHDHYRVTGAAPGTLTLANTGTYDEACRVIRVDGVWRVAADLRDDYFAMLETNNSGTLTDTDETARPYSPTTAAVSNYEDFVLDYLDDRIANNTVTTTYNTASSGSFPLNTGSYESTWSLNNPTSAIQVPSTAAVDTDASKWLHARGLYIDYLEPDAITAITDARTNCPDTSTQTLRSACILPYVPFTSINLTELAEWQSQNPVSTTNFNVTDSFPYDSTNANKPKRGNVFAGGSPSNNATGTIYANLSESNAGLALILGTDHVSRYESIDTDEQTNFNAVSPSKGHDSQAVQINGGGGGGGTNFTLLVTNTPPVSPTITAIGGSPSTGTCTMNTNPANCTVTPNGSMKLQIDGYTKASTITVPNGCKANGDVSLPIIKDYDITYARNVTQGNLAATSIVASNDHTITDRTIITFAGTVNAADQLEIRFDGNPNPEWWCPTNYSKQQNKPNGGSPDPSELNCSGNNPTFDTTYQLCPSGTPGMPVASP